MIRSFPIVPPHRRTFLGLLTAGLADACVRPDARPSGRRGLDTVRLNAEFPALVERARPAVFNIGLTSLPDGASWIWRADARFPMQSVFKAPLAAAVLSAVDAGRLRLNQYLEITAADLSGPSGPVSISAAWPPNAPDHRLRLPLADLLALAVQRSDNTAADVIMAKLGGPQALTAWLGANAIPDMRVDRYERQLQQDVAGMPAFQPEWRSQTAWTAARSQVAAQDRETAMNAYLNDPRDTTSLPGALDFLAKLDNGTLIAAESTRFLLRLMTTTATGAHRFIAGLPPGSRLAHKTGSAATDLGLTPATNEIGIITLANGRRFAAAAFLAKSTATETQRDALLADAARLMAACV